jgi:hypothetical protein
MMTNTIRKIAAEQHSKLADSLDRFVDKYIRRAAGVDEIEAKIIYGKAENVMSRIVSEYRLNGTVTITITINGGAHDTKEAWDTETTAPPEG